MKLILDEWIVREVIDTLYMARTTLLGITGLDSTQEVEKKSANETAITRRISKAIDIIQQSEQQSLPEELEEAARLFAIPHYMKDIDKEHIEEYPYDMMVETAFKAGAKWQKEQDEKEQADLFTIVALDAAQRAKEKMMKEAVEGEVFDYSSEHNLKAIGLWSIDEPISLNEGDKVKLVIIKED